MIASGPGCPPRVVVADDHERIQQILAQVTREILPLAEVIETVDDEEALEACRSGRCDFLASNHNIPRIGGLELVRIVRAESSGLPILMVSVHPEVRKDAMEAGANWFLSKEQIMERMPRLLREHTNGGIAPERK